MVEALRGSIALPSEQGLYFLGGRDPQVQAPVPLLVTDMKGEIPGTHKRSRSAIPSRAAPQLIRVQTRLRTLSNASVCAFSQDNVDLGELMFSLCYLPTAGRLTITIIKARNLKAMDITGASGRTFSNSDFLIGF